MASQVRKQKLSAACNVYHELDDAMKDLDAMSLDELKSLQKDVAKAIEGYEKRQRAIAMAEAEKAARQHGFSLAELTAMKAGGAKQKNPPKYVHPENPEMTWTGRGRKPKWINEALEKGKSLDDFLIAK